MAAAGNMGEDGALPDNGLEFLLDPVDSEVVADVEVPDPLAARDLVATDMAGADSSCAVVVGHLGGAAEPRDSGGKRKQ